MQNIVAIVMAAGLSSRMGKFKQLLPYKDKTVLTYILSELLASKVSNTYVVIGHNNQQVLEKVSGYKVQTIYNPDYQEGMHTSVMCGVNAIDQDCDGFMVVLGDQPEISFNLVNSLIDYKQQSDKGIIIPSFNFKAGHPVVFDKKYIPLVSEINPESGLKSLVSANKHDIDYMNVTDESILIDIDTPSDYEKLVKRST
ncbi:MAG: NTP transferase domain-containing protein [Vampirovibrionia bacterium]